MGAGLDGKCTAIGARRRFENTVFETWLIISDATLQDSHEASTTIRRPVFIMDLFTALKFIGVIILKSITSTEMFWFKSS